MTNHFNEQPALLRTYNVKYIHESPTLPKPTSKAVFQLFNNGFVVECSLSQKIWIPYNTVFDFKITRESINHWTHFYNDILNERVIQIEYRNDKNQQSVVKLLMPTGWSRFNSKKGYEACQELVSFMKSNGVFDKFISATKSTSSPDIMSQIEKLADLHKQGILTDTEFESKKAELLRRL